MKELDDSKPAGDLITTHRAPASESWQHPNHAWGLLCTSARCQLTEKSHPAVDYKDAKVLRHLLLSYLCNSTHPLGVSHLFSASPSSITREICWLLTGEQEEGQVTKFFYRSLYLPSQGMFCELPANLELGSIQVRTQS